MVAALFSNPSVDALRILTRLLIMVSVTVSVANALASASVPPASPTRVLVSGAGGQTGQSVFRKMLAEPETFLPFGIVRSETSKQVLVDSGVPADQIVVADVTDASAMKAAVETAGGKDLKALCICTSAKPAPTGETDEDTGRPVFAFPNGDPEQVDWIGQKNQIDSVASIGGCHVVLCSTMGGTNPDHPLNALGRTTNEKDGTYSGGMIVQWKRKAEVYLMGQSSTSFTIVHPGGLINEAGGERELVVGVDDSMDGTDSRTVPREDVAQVMLEAVRFPQQYAGRSFDLRAKPIGEGLPTTNFEDLLESLGGKNCDYELGAIM